MGVLSVHFLFNNSNPGSKSKENWVDALLQGYKWLPSNNLMFDSNYSDHKYISYLITTGEDFVL